MIKPRLEMKLYDQYGNVKYTTYHELDLLDERLQVSVLPIYKENPIATFDECIQQLKLKSYREVSFKDIGHKLGALMAQGLSDVEGWHGEYRKEKTIEAF